MTSGLFWTAFLSAAAGFAFYYATCALVIQGSKRRGELKWANSGESREYHNKQIYYNLSLFVKMVLAIAGGAAFFLMRPEVKRTGSQYASLLEVVQFIVGMAGTVLSYNILMHEARKIMHDKTLWDYRLPLEWSECVWVTAMIAVTGVLVFWSIPRIMAP